MVQDFVRSPNALKYPELLAVIIAVYSSTQGTVDIRDNLEKQLMVLLVKEGRSAEPGSSK